MTLGQNTTGRDLKTHFVYLGMCMVAALCVLAVRLYRLQITRADEFRQKSVINYMKEVRIPAVRGNIVDRRGETLVDSRVSFDVTITPAFCERCFDEVLPRLAQLLQWDLAQTTKAESQMRFGKRNAPFQSVVVRLDLTRDELDVLNAHLLDLPGVEIRKASHRNYRYGSMMAHSLGYLSEITEDELNQKNAAGANYAMGDYVGRSGIERSLEGTLRGTDGVRKEVVNARGKVITELNDLLSSGREILSKPGKNIVLSLDLRLQQEAERAFPGEAGTIIALDVRTGFVLAMVSRPSFDPNLLTGRVTPGQFAALVRDPLQPMIFRATAQHYSPGSTFKPVSLLAALRSGHFTSHSTATCGGGYRLGSRVWRCHKVGGHGVVDPRRALQVSCDTFFYKVADTLGLDPIAQMGASLGFGAPTGIGVVREEPGIMPNSEYHNRVTPGGYTKGMALNSSIGQGDDNVTPIQLVLAYAAIANGGTLYQPQLLRRIDGPDGQTLETFEPKVTRKVELNPADRQLVIDGLIDVVNETGGTGGRGRLKNIVVAGKTGTAQVAKLGAVQNLKKEQMEYVKRDHAWFVAFAPAQDPEIAVVVLNEHGGHGGSDAAPAAAAVMQKYFDIKAQDGNPAVSVPTQAPGMDQNDSSLARTAPTERP